MPQLECKRGARLTLPTRSTTSTTEPHIRGSRSNWPRSPPILSRYPNTAASNTRRTPPSPTDIHGHRFVDARSHAAAAADEDRGERRGADADQPRLRGRPLWQRRPAAEAARRQGDGEGVPRLRVQPGRRQLQVRRSRSLLPVNEETSCSIDRLALLAG
jgi:hypothetical protein